MGRTEKSQGLAPPAVRKDIRAKQAKNVINKVVPALLASNSRAQRGVDSSELIADPASSSANNPGKLATELDEDAGYVKRKGQGRRKNKAERDVDTGEAISRPKGKRGMGSVDLDIGTLSMNKPTTITVSPPRPRKVRIVTTDTLTAAHVLTYPSRYGATEPKLSKKSPNVCILNMASPLRPGGGVLTGATSQEEFLCARTTLLPSLQESYYRLPELGGIWSPDILVFANSLPLGDAKGDLGLSDRYWVDVISAGMLRFPELEGEEDEVKRLSSKDRKTVENKMRAVLRIAAQKGVKKLVLGAWGCGAYGNPVIDIAQAWKRILDGASSLSNRKGKSEPETFSSVEEVIFAIGNRNLAMSFAQAFDKKIEVEAGPGENVEDDDEEESEDKAAEELRAKIKEMENEMSSVWNPDSRARRSIILDGLKAQLNSPSISQNPRNDRRSYNRRPKGTAEDDESEADSSEEDNDFDEDEDESSTGAANLTPDDSNAEDDG
jgi:uncharacterized protein (TIGR02452 family)